MTTLNKTLNELAKTLERDARWGNDPALGLRLANTLVAGAFGDELTATSHERRARGVLSRAMDRRMAKLLGD